MAGASASLTTTSEASAAPVQIASVRLRDINEQLVPSKLVRGDREFGGNGPHVRCEVTLSVTADQRAILAAVSFRAMETKADWSETAGSWSREVYRAPAGRRIEGIADGSSSVVQFVSKPGGFQLLGRAEDFSQVLQGLQKVHEALLVFAGPGAPPAHTTAQRAMKQLSDKVILGTAYLAGQGNHVHLRAPSSGPVQLVGIVGDTAGPDISADDDPKDDTRVVGVKFKPIKIRLK
jgi:hypothetical protein